MNATPSGNLFRQKTWSPYLVGAGIGVLSWFAFATAERPLGITTAFENTAALIGKPVFETRGNTEYYQAKAAQGKEPRVDWEWTLVVGVFFGALLSSSVARDRTREKVPALWQWRFGPSVTGRFAAAFLGGALMMFGARWAQGCTSGHGISGALQLALSSWAFLIVIFASAVGVAFLMFGKEGRNHV
jgi:uncharacterized protein